MNESTTFFACAVTCLVLLSSCRLQCLAFQNTEPQHARQPELPAALAANRLEDTENASASSLEGRSGLPEQTISAAASDGPYRASGEPSGISLNTVVGATPQTSLGVQGLLGHQVLPVYTTALPLVGGTESQLASSKPETERKENGSHKSLLPVRVWTSPNPNGKDNVFSSTVDETMEGDSKGAGHDSTGNPKEDVFAPSAPEEGAHSGVPQLTTEDSLFWLPPDQSPRLVPTAGRLLDSERVSNEDGPSLAADTTATASLISVEALGNPEKDTSKTRERSEVTLGPATVALATTLPSDDWDDTKLGATGQARGATAMLVDRPQTASESYPGEGKDEDDDEVKRILPPRLSSSVVKNGSVQNTLQQGELATVSSSQNLVHATNESPKEQDPPARAMEKAEQVVNVHEAGTTIDTTKLDVFQTLKNTLKGNTPDRETGYV